MASRDFLDMIWLLHAGESVVLTPIVRDHGRGSQCCVAILRVSSMPSIRMDH